jgi:pimeloyl-ACP methyl ester carboxylesterase
MEYLFNPKKGYEELWKAIIRPPRAEYEEADLGPEIFYVGRAKGKREDLTLKNTRNQTLQCSWFKILGSNEPKPTVIYLHGNSSCRLEAIGHVIQMLSQGINLFCFDFAGCGLSEGEYISLGFYESQDLKTIVDFLREQDSVSQIGLWGRSMGSVTALMHADQDPALAAIVLDSPFCSLKELALGLAKAKAKIPNFITGSFLGMIRSTIMEKAKFDIDKLNPLENHVGRSLSPAFFISAEEDELIPADHAKKLHEAYKGQGRYMLVKGTHNSEREEYVNDAISIFFYNCFGLDIIEGKKKEAKRGEAMRTVRHLEKKGVGNMTESEQLQYALQLSLNQK